MKWFQELEVEKGNGRSLQQLVKLPDIFIHCKGRGKDDSPWFWCLRRKKEPVTKDGFVKRWGTKGKARYSSPGGLERSKWSNYFGLNWKGLSRALPRGVGVCDGPQCCSRGGMASPCNPAASPGPAPMAPGKGCGSWRSLGCGSQRSPGCSCTGGSRWASEPAPNKTAAFGSKSLSPWWFITYSLSTCQKWFLASPKATTDGPQVPNLLNVYAHTYI